MATPASLDNILWGCIILFGLCTTQLWRIINCLQSLSAEKVRGAQPSLLAQLEPWGHCPQKCDFPVPMMSSSLYVQLRERMGTGGFSGRWSEGLGGRTRGRRKAEEAQRRRLKNGVKDNQETTSPPHPSLREPWRLRRRGGRCGGSQRQRPGGRAGQRLHNIYRKIRHPQASSPTSSHPEQFWADRGSGGGREACLGPPWRRGGRAVC